MVLSRATYLVSVGNNINSRASPTISHALLPVTSKVDKLPMETEPVAQDTNASWTLKPGHQTFVACFSTDNRRKDENEIDPCPQNAIPFPSETQSKRSLRNDVKIVKSQ